ncbi:MAG TPA: ubiquinone/menaquinone biosynthesis methyltransferase [Polyangia bacterium]|jgi:ubiquinone/menaquinone biosynthesis methyltransferase|nr:ubiquinone/menaquinone biosynthesis methyltransferase [Polyangia bacterium]
MTSLASEGADVQGLFNRVAERYDAANRVMSAGVDVLWRRKAIGRLLQGLGAEPRVLDLGAGTLDGAIEIARRAPGARIAAADFAREMLRVGRHKIPTDARIDTHAADGHHLPYRAAAFDGAFSAFCVRNLSDLPRGMGELRRVIRPGGRVVILEFFRPEKPRFFFDKIYNAHVLPLLGWAVTGDREAYRYLPASIEKFASVGEFEAVLRAAGFAAVESQPLFPSGVASMVVAA